MALIALAIVPIVLQNIGRPGPWTAENATSAVLLVVGIDVVGAGIIYEWFREGD